MYLAVFLKLVATSICCFSVWDQITLRFSFTIHGSSRLVYDE